MPAIITKRLARNLGILLSAVLLSGGALLSLPPPPAGAATPTRLTNLRFSWMGGLLARTQVRYVTVSLTLVDPDGIGPSSVTWAGAPLSCPCVLVEHVVKVEPRSRQFRTVHLRLARGTTTNGIWIGRFAVGAADAGFWRPTQMAAGDIVGTVPTPVPHKTPTATPAPWNTVTVNVRGYDWPRIWLGTPVAIGSQFFVRGGVALSRSGMPVSGVMRMEVHNSCRALNQESQLQLGRGPVLANVHGRFFYYVKPDQLRRSFGVCVAWVIYPTDTRDSFVVQSNIRTRG